jgi:hypothetical protein
MFQENELPFDIHKLYAQINKGRNPYTKTMGQGDTQYQHTTMPALPDSMNHRSDNDCVKANYVDPKNIKQTHPWCFDKNGRFKPTGMKPDFNYAKTSVDRLGSFQTDSHGDQEYVQAAKEFADQNGYGFQYAGGKITFTRQSPGFKEWLQLQEFSDINAMDTGHIELNQNGNTYTSQFDFNGTTYKITFTPQQEPILDTPLTGYSISFTANGEYRPTYQQGSSASEIYSEIMLVIKKFLEDVQRNTEHPAQYITFVGAAGKQDLVYDRLVSRFLKTYTRVSFDKLVRNDVLEQIKADKGHDKITKDVQSGQMDHKRVMNSIRNRRSMY